MKKLILLSVVGLISLGFQFQAITTYAANAHTPNTKAQVKSANAASDSQKRTKAQSSSKENQSTKKSNTNGKPSNNSNDKKNNEAKKVQTKGSQKNSNNQTKAQGTTSKNRDAQSKTVQNSKSDAKANSDKIESSSSNMEEVAFENGNLSADDWKIEIKESPASDDDFSAIKGNKRAFSFFNNKRLVLSVSAALIALAVIGIVFFSSLYIRNSNLKKSKNRSKSAAHFRLF